MRHILAAATLAAAVALPAAAQQADWQRNPLPLLQGEWEYWGPEDNRSWGGYAKIRITDRNVVLLDALHPEYAGSPWTRAPAGATIMTIESWKTDSTTGDNQVIVVGTCYDYSNSNGRPGYCWHVLTKYSEASRNRQGKPTAWSFSIFERLRDGTTGEAAGYAKAAPAAEAPRPDRAGARREVPPAAVRPAPAPAAPAVDATRSAADEAAEERRLAAAAQRIAAGQQAARAQQEEAERRYRAEQERFKDGLERARQAEQLFAEQRAQHELALADAAIAQARYEEETALQRKDAAAAAAAAQRRREQEARRQAAEAKRRALEAPVDWVEGVAVCDKDTPQHRFGNWRCRGPLQMTYAKLDTPQAEVALGQACGVDGGIRDLGAANGLRLFGCGYGIHPSPNMRDTPMHGDPAAAAGIGAIPGRAVFRCPAKQTNICRSR